MTWSLYKKSGEQEASSTLGSGLFNYTGEQLSPLKFSNGKTQEDVVQEVLENINKGHKVIFIKGVCGSGKSAMALNLAKYFKKTSIVVPIKSLQEQYERDYMRNKFILKEDNNPLKISVIKGRNNFPCKYAGGNADNPMAPCIIEIREKNTDELLKFIHENPVVDAEDFSSATDVRRMNIAPACPHWSPIMPADINPKGLRSDDYKKKNYQAVNGQEFAVFKRKAGCPYYDQYDAYTDADVLIFNAMKYHLEMDMGRKPKTDLDIIDECDEFLDSFSNERRLNLSRLHGALTNLMPVEAEKKHAIRDMLRVVNDILFANHKDDIEKIKATPLMPLIELILKNPDVAEDEETSYYHNALEIARGFEGLLDETYAQITKIKKDDNQKGLFLAGKNFSSDDIVIADIVSINLAQKFKDLVNANNVMVLMSGTLHSEEVLKDIFGLENFVVIEAETKNPGSVIKMRTGLERNCSYANFNRGGIDRKTYLKSMDVCMANAQEPTLIHVSAFKDLPTGEENEEFKFDNLLTKERLREEQMNANLEIDRFTQGSKKTLFTTKCSRGVDFPGDKCNSIVITRYPYPNIQGIFWKILKKEQPEKFMEFYMDKARRELLQKVARGVRFPGDKVELWSPDTRVLNENFE